MDWKEALLQRLDSYHFVLVDTNFFSGVIGSASRIRLARELYDIREPSGLSALEIKINQSCQETSWKLNNIVIRENVFTLPLIIEELKNFEQILFSSYHWHSRILKSIQRRKSPIQPYPQRRRRSRRINRLIEKARAESLERDTNFYQAVPALNYLRAFIENIHQITQQFKVYSGLIKELPSNIPNASKTDYQLVGAAYGYRLKNYHQKAAILSFDYHISQIKYAHQELEGVFDIIDFFTLTQACPPEKALST